MNGAEILFLFMRRSVIIPNAGKTLLEEYEAGSKGSSLTHETELKEQIEIKKHDSLASTIVGRMLG
jgi:hypothetical protein